MKKCVIAFLPLFLLTLVSPKFECLADEINEKFRNEGIYIIEEIKVEGNEDIPKNIFITLSGLKVGEVLKLYDTKLNEAMNKIWKRHIIDDVSIEANILSEDKISLIIKVKLGKILTEFNFEGLSEKEEDIVRQKSNLIRGTIVTDSFLKNIKDNIISCLSKKGYFYPDIKISKKADKNLKNGLILDIKVTKNNAQKVHKIYFKGNNIISSIDLKHKMVATKEIRRPSILTRIIKSFFTKAFRTYKSPKDRLVRISSFKDEIYALRLNLFGTSFNEEMYERKDLESIKREIYYKRGYIDAAIIKSEFKRYDEQTVDLYIEVYEGPRYILNDIKWVGNKLFTDEQLTELLGVKKGSYFDKHTLEKNLLMDPEFSITILYHNHGYLFSNIKLEINKIDGNKVDIIIKIDEGVQATINKVSISGTKISKDRTIRKYLYTIPTHKYRYIDILRSKNELGRSGIIKVDKFKYFPMPDKKNKTVDIEYVLEENLDIQFQARFSISERGPTGTIGGQFNNLSLGRIFKKELPFGGGQTGSFSLEKSFGFTKVIVGLDDPWVINWGRYPINFNSSIWHSWQDKSQEPIYPLKNQDLLATTKSSKGDKISKIKKGYDGFIRTTGFALGLGKRLSTLTDTTVSTGFSYAYKSYKEFEILHKDKNRRTGKSIDLNMSLGIKKDNTDGPFYPTLGYKVGLSGILTPPYSLLNNDNPTKISNKYAEYHKWTFSAAKFNEILKYLVFAANFELGFLGAYSAKYGVGPYRRYYLGGEGMVADYNSVLSQSAILLRGYSSSFHVPKSKSGFYGGVIYDKLTFEIRHMFRFISFMPIYGLVFCEGGNTWAEYNKFNFSEILGYASFGFGFRAVIPMIGPLGIHFGFAIDKKNKNIAPEIHLSSGIA